MGIGCFGRKMSSPISYPIAHTIAIFVVPSIDLFTISLMVDGLLPAALWFGLLRLLHGWIMGSAAQSYGERWSQPLIVSTVRWRMVFLVITSTSHSSSPPSADLALCPAGRGP